jgi:hypothetical protein
MILGGRRERKKPGKRKQGRPSDGCGEGGREEDGQEGHDCVTQYV